MACQLVSQKQELLFQALSQYPSLIFAAGVSGVSANIVGRFQVRRHGSEDRLDMGDGQCHVHIDWNRVKRVEIGDFHGEGVLTFFCEDEILFRLYNPSGLFAEDVTQHSGPLIENAPEQCCA